MKQNRAEKRNRSALLGIDSSTAPTAPSLTVIQDEIKTIMEEPESTPAAAPAAVPTPAPAMRPGTGWSLSVARGSNPVGAVGSAIGSLRGQSNAEIAALKSQLESGDTVIELETDKIDRSFVSDRMETSDLATTDLVEQIKSQGQLVPILVRPHPEHQGRYQVAFGHRRLKAAKKLGRPVRAVVRNLTDEELVIAQGQENNARLDLSYIERALFAAKLEEGGFTRQVIGAALAVSKTELSGLISVATKIPRDVVTAIGAAPGIGRPRWHDLVEIFKQQKCFDRAAEIISKPDFQEMPTDKRFVTLFAKLSKQEKTEATPSQQHIFWNDPRGRRVARITDSNDRVTFQIDKTVDDKFGAYLISRLDELYREYEQSGSTN
ncbi:plasmid partitioning protein RepB [Microvirga aerophila]|uniref:Plasmid partitioning protein RepB n=1 Tax=Microvirga aerophila TaxID=670291 RepID=A0A512C1F5_9HYPH|nr:plasmid partitioning protein RepB [Microvirga aerophila]GEO18045.1 plasmid partitioning protein RepB [Microvirga aerophila]